MPTVSAGGDVAERNELLNGSYQLVLDGTAAGGDAERRMGYSARWEIDSSLSWPLGRDGEVELDEGDLTLRMRGAPELRELSAVLESGTAEVDPDTGVARVKASFRVDEVTGRWLGEGSVIEATYEVDGDGWQAEIELPEA